MMSSFSLQKLLIVGLDGADWRLLTPWFEAGKLPTLARLTREGANGLLRSTIRPESSVAWSSFATGVNAGKHGVFGFMVREGEQYKIADGSIIQTPRWWEKTAKRTVLLNVPFTYPVRAFNGICVSGMMTPGTHRTFAHPPQLNDQLSQRFPQMLFDAGGNAPDLVQKCHDFTAQQAEMASLLLDEKWDCFTIVFTAPDRLQHFAWQKPQTLLALYEQIDTAIAEIIEKAQPDATLVMSDHGFNGVNGRFYVNQWLINQGYLVRKTAGLSWRSRLIPLAKKAQSNKQLRALKRWLAPEIGGASSLSAASFGESIDWVQSQAVFTPDGGIRILKPAVLGKLTEELRGLRHPITNELVLETIHKKEDLYEGAQTDNAPDLILEPRREDERVHVVLDGSLEVGDRWIVDSAAPYTANHALNGILIAHGKGIKEGKINHASIIDIAPTVLAMLGDPIPRWMDGQVLQEIFAQPINQRFLDETLSGEVDGGVLGEGNTDSAVADRLRALGYID